MKEIPLTQGKVALVDDEDFERLSQFKWCAWWCPTTRSYYAVRRAKGGGTIHMHRVLSGPPTGMDIDHVNRDTLDNQKANLRACTRAQNLCNKIKRRGKTSSIYKGVHRNGALGWMAQCGPRGTHRYIGTFSSEKEAGEAYNEAAKARFGDYAYLNIIEEEI